MKNTALSYEIEKQQNSRWDRYLGMTAAMTQVPVPTARPHWPVRE